MRGAAYAVELTGEAVSADLGDAISPRVNPGRLHLFNVETGARLDDAAGAGAHAA